MACCSQPTGEESDPITYLHHLMGYQSAELFVGEKFHLRQAQTPLSTSLNPAGGSFAADSALQQNTHRLVGHDADAVGEVASHHARQPLCLGNVLQALPHAVVGLRIRRGRGQQLPTSSCSGRLTQFNLHAAVGCQQLPAGSTNVKKPPITTQLRVWHACCRAQSRLPWCCPGSASGSSAAPGAPPLCETCSAMQTMQMTTYWTGLFQMRRRCKNCCVLGQPVHTMTHAADCHATPQQNAARHQAQRAADLASRWSCAASCCLPL